MTAEEAFNRYHEAVFRFLYRMTRCADTAEDITQDCFLALVRAPERFDVERGPIKTYLFSIARNLALKEYRDRRVEVTLESGEFAPQSDPRDFEVASAVERAVSGLPPLQQEALILFTYEGFTIEEIGAITGADGGAVKSRLHRARERLKKELAAYKTVGD